MKDKILNELEEISKMLNRAAIAGCKNFVIPFHQNFIQTLKNKIINFSILIKDTFPFQSKLIFNTKDDLFYGYNYINLFALGLIDSQIKYIQSKHHQKRNLLMDIMLMRHFLHAKKY